MYRFNALFVIDFAEMLKFKLCSRSSDSCFWIINCSANFAMSLFITCAAFCVDVIKLLNASEGRLVSSDESDTCLTAVTCTVEIDVM